jgi:hypothetical protein
LSKTVKAEEVGARAIIITNQDPESDEFYIEMIDDNTFREAHIPAGFLLGKNGYVYISHSQTTGGIFRGLMDVLSRNGFMMPN